MARYIVLLRGVNLGPRNRVAMPELREALEDAGFEDVKTYLQSGNVVLSSKASAKRVARECERLIAERFGLDVKVMVRTRAELAEIVNRNPLGKVAQNPKRYQVSFLDAKPDPKAVRKLSDAAVAPERVAHVGLRALRLASGRSWPLEAGCAGCRGGTWSHRDGALLDYSDEASRDRR